MDSNRSIEGNIAVSRIDRSRVPYIRLRASAQGIALGTVLGLSVFVATNFLVIKGGDRVGPHLSLLSQFFLGYRVSFVGSLIGALYGFVLGYALGHINAGIYNRFAKSDTE
jgi:ABC-type dipeptide/oligopeptide/nickel transport system permease subunit